MVRDSADCCIGSPHLSAVVAAPQMQRAPAARRKGLCESMARWFFQQTVLALDYCHKMRISNRDVKLENTLLDSDGTQGKRPLIKLCDFGYSINETHSMAKTAVGTPGYTGEPLCLYKASLGKSGAPLDVAARQ